MHPTIPTCIYSHTLMSSVYRQCEEKEGKDWCETEEIFASVKFFKESRKKEFVSFSQVDSIVDILPAKRINSLAQEEMYGKC